MNERLRATARLVLPLSVRRRLLSAWSRARAAASRTRVHRSLLSAWSLARAPDRKASFLYALRAFGRKLAHLFYITRVGTFISKAILDIAIWLGPRISALRLWQGQVRTLWGVTPILTLPLKASADRALGFRSTSLVYTTYVISSQFDINLRRPYALACGLDLGLAFQRLVLAWTLLRYDVFHFFADRGLLDSLVRLQINSEELAALRRAGKRVYVYAYGADVRTRQATLALGSWNFCTDCTDPPKYCTCHDAEAQRYVSELDKAVTALVSLGDMLTYMPTARHINYWPVDLDRMKVSVADAACGPLRIAHAPNHTHFKGSKYLQQTIEKLRTQGRQIEYRKIQGVPNDQVLSLFAESDIVADQFIGGAYGYTALEGMALGKPVLSFVRSADLVDAPDECPIINTTPDELEQVLLWIIENRNHLRLIGEQGRSYVERWHTVSAVAARLGQLYEDTANFPATIQSRIQAMREQEEARRNSIPVGVGWQHPFQITRQETDRRIGAVARSGT